MDFGRLLQSVKDSFTARPSVLGNVLQQRQWNEGLPRFGGVAPENQMLHNPNIISPIDTVDEVTPGLEYGRQLDEELANLPPNDPTPTPKFNDVLGMTKSAPPVPNVTPPPHEGALPYYQDINKAAAENEVPQDLFYNLLHAESNFDPDVIFGRRVSPAGAQGIAQFMPATSKGMGFDPLDPKQAIPASAKYIRAKYDEGGEDWRLALARYNAGSGNVRKYGGIPPFPETQRYIEKIMGK